MSLHHIGDEVTALRILRDRLDLRGTLGIAELAEPMRVLPGDLALGPPGLSERLAAASARWFADMRAGLPGSVPSEDLPSMLTAAGFEVVGARLAHVRLDPPLPDDARRLVLGQLRRAHDQLTDHLDPDDLRTLEILIDADDHRGVMHRSDVFIDTARHIVVARPIG
jgi:hypothetical protein